MAYGRRICVFVGICTAIAFESHEADAQGFISCLPMTRGPNYSFAEVLDAADFTPNGIRTNDRGHALIQAQPAATLSGQCLLRNRGSQTETVVCTRNIDPTSPFTAISSPDWNERGAIVVAGTLVQTPSIPNPSISHIQVIQTNGAISPLPTYNWYLGGQSVKSHPEITGQGDIFYRTAAGNLQRFVATLPGDDRSETIVPGTTLAISRVESAGEGKLYFNAGPRWVGSVQNALEPLAGPTPPYFTAVDVDDAVASAVPTPNRFGAFVYRTQTDIRRRLDVGGVDFVAGDPEFVVEWSGTPDAPVRPLLETLAGPCKVALLGSAPGVCRDGPNDGLICDPDAEQDACLDGPGGPSDGYCDSGLPGYGVQGIFVHQAGSYAAVVRVGDAMLGSTASVFYSFGGPSDFVGSTAGHIFFPVRLADGRNVIVRADPGSSVEFPTTPTSCVGASCVFALEPTGWLGVGVNGVPLFFDADIATGYDYTLDPGDPRFATVMVPEPLSNGDESFMLQADEQSFPLTAGEQFDLTQIDPLGVAMFSIRGIDAGEDLDPESPVAFVTGVTFMDERGANVTSTIFVPEPDGAVAGVAALGVLASLARRRRSRAAASARD